MSAVLCSQCSAPLSMEAAQGRAPCGSCGIVNAPPANPYAPQMVAQGPMAFHAAPSGEHALVCPACRRENAPDTKFCRGCGNLLPRAAADAPLAPQMFAQGPTASSAPQPVAHVWACPACRHENQAHYKFCLGCGAVRGEGGGAPIERRDGYDGNPTYSRRRSPVVLVVLIVTIITAGAIAAAAALILAR